MVGKVDELWDAADSGRLPDVQRLLTEGASPDAKAGKYGYPALGQAAENGHLDVVKALVRAGAKLEAPDSDARTALMWAAGEGRHDCVERRLGAPLLAGHLPRMAGVARRGAREADVDADACGGCGAALARGEPRREGPRD